MFPLGVFVLCGLDILVKHDFKELEGRHVGLITNHTGRTLDGQHGADLFAKSTKLNLVALFSPEHGLRGEKDESVMDSKDTVTGKPVYSLYNLKEQGDARFSPSPEQLKGIDTLVFDIQDVGARFYTYTSTMGFAMQAAAKAKIKFVVLDRPNPIGGTQVEGNVNTPDFRGITAFFPVPTRHGMTAGEMAVMYNRELKLGLDLQVIKCEGWKRSMWFDQTGQPWINPSPNMRTMNAATLYPGLCLLEATNISVGRGTDLPFERIGAPYIDGFAFANIFNQLKLPGISAHPVRFTPNASKFAGEECQGMQFIITNRDKFQPVRMGFELARILVRHAQDWKHDGFIRLVMNKKAADSVLGGGEGVDPAWSDGLAAFLPKRKASLLY